MKSFNTKGTWTIPGNTHNLAGELFFDAKEGTFLRTPSLFQGVVYSMFTEIPIIHGLVYGKLKYTLLNCSVHANQGPETGFRAGLIIEGYHLQDKEELITTGVRFRVSKLNEWLLVSGFKYPAMTDETHIDVNYKRPDPFSFSVGDDTEGEIGCTEIINKGKYNTSIEQDSYMRLTFKDVALTYLNALNRFTSFYQFLTFALQHAPEIKEISLQLSQQLDNPEKPKIWLPVFFQNKPAALEKENWITTRFLFYRAEVAELSKTITKWYEIDRVAGPSLKMLFDTYLNASFDENTFINQCQALESFHRSLYPADPAAAEAHEAKVQAIYEQVSNPGHLKWLKEELRYSGQLKLRQRLKAIRNDIEKFQVIKDLGFDKNLIDLIVNNRNEYTHYSGDGNNILTESALARLTAKLRIIFTVTLLKHLGFSEERINQFYLSGRYLNFHFATR